MVNTFANSPSMPISGQNMGRCIAVWCSWKNPSSDLAPGAELRLHVNLWRLDRKLNGLTISALDIGFRVSKATLLKSMHFFVPFSVTCQDITDLGSMLADPDIAIAVFNEDAKVTGTATNQSSFSIELDPEKLSCWKLDPASELEFIEVTESSQSRGTMITFDPKVFEVNYDQAERYVRLRINLSSEAEKAFFTRYDPEDRRFLSGFDEIEVVDFRFNETRNLPRSVIARMNSNLKIPEINYFVIRDITDDLTLSHSNLKKCRTLESPVWSKYLQENGSTPAMLRNAIIFYWQKLGEDSNSIKDYNALARFRRRKTDLPAIIWFVVSTLGIGILSGLLSGVIVAHYVPTVPENSGDRRPSAGSEPDKPVLPSRSNPTEKRSTPD